MKKFQINYLLALMALCILSFSSFGQIGNPPPGPCNFTETESFCFTNNSNYNVVGSNPITAGCDYEICVKIKPKATCEINCEMLLNPNGYYVEQCQIIAVGETFCFNLPTPSHPITDCFEVEITMKVVNRTPTISRNFEQYFPQIGCMEVLQDHCNDIWWSALKRVNGTGTYNFRITTYAVLGE